MQYIIGNYSTNCAHALSVVNIISVAGRQDHIGPGPSHCLSQHPPDVCPMLKQIVAIINRTPGLRLQILFPG